MNKERLIMPFVILCLLSILVYGFVYLSRNLKSKASSISNSTILCGDISSMDAILLFNESECSEAGSILLDEYVCNLDIGRLDIPINVMGERSEVCDASCYVYTESREVVLQWMCNGLLE